MDLEAFRWLLTEDGPAAAGAGRRGDRRRAARPRPPSGVRAAPEHVAAALTQVELRRKAEPKFGDLAARMYFTPDGLEQATRRPSRPTARRG